MQRVCENPAATDLQSREGGMGERKLSKSMMFFTTEARAERLKLAARVLESVGITFDDARGHTGLLNDWIEEGLRAYVTQRLEDGGLSKAAIRYELEKLK